MTLSSGATWDLGFKKSDEKTDWCLSWQSTPVCHNGGKDEGQGLPYSSSDYVWQGQTEVR